MVRYTRQCSICREIVPTDDTIFLGGVTYCRDCLKEAKKSNSKGFRRCISCKKMGTDLVNGESIDKELPGFYCPVCLQVEVEKLNDRKYTESKSNRPLYSIECTRCNKPMGKGTHPAYGEFYCNDCYKGKKPSAEDESPWEQRIANILQE